MKKMRNLKKLLYIALPLMALTILAACSKKEDDDPRKNFPRTASIEYRVTAVSGTPGLTDILYTNETGATTTLDDQTLPFSKKFNKSVAFAEIMTVSAYTTGPGSIRLEILVDGVVAKTVTPSSNSYINDNISFQFAK